MEYTKGIITETKSAQEFIYPREYEQAANSYLMAVVAVMCGLPFPIINLIASVGYYLAHRKAAYIVRWHCIQATLGQAMLIPFNSVAVAWTLRILFNSNELTLANVEAKRFPFHSFTEASSSYWLYVTFIILLNITEFFVVIYTSSRVKRGENVRWFGLANITDRLCSKEDRNPYKL